VDQFASWLSAAPMNIGVSNPGVVASEHDPPWLRSLSLALGPSSNQLAFVVLTTYRDHLTVLVTTDDDKLPRPVADAFVAGLARRIGSEPPPEGANKAPDHPATRRRPIVTAMTPVVAAGARGAAKAPSRPA
jgi:hypothetical protein